MAGWALHTPVKKQKDFETWRLASKIIQVVIDHFRSGQILFRW